MNKKLPTKNTEWTIRSNISFLMIFLSFIGISFSCSKAAENRPTSNMAAAREAKKEVKQLRENIKNIEPFFSRMGKPEAYDWLGSHNEPGQTFDEYLDSETVKPTKERQRIYVLPLGTFTAQQKKAIDITARYLEIFYDLEVKQMPGQSLTAIYPNARENKLLGNRQIKTSYILNDKLKPILPADAAALIAFTNSDLYPDAAMNYVFGQASLESRVGVWSLYRLEKQANFETFLRRTLKIAAHETGHMFSMWHCTKYECLMSGTNHIAETDRRPIDACPECSAKVCWLSDVDQRTRYDKLAAFCRRNGMNNEASEFSKKSVALAGK